MMLGNECVTSSPVEKLKENGSLEPILSSPVSRKDEAATGHLSPENHPGQHQGSGPTPNTGSHVLEDAVTPDVKSHCKSKYFACPTSGSLKYLHRTPPSRTKSIVVSNPFDVGITDRLHLPIYSPSVFARVVSPSQDSPTFRWTIEDISRIYPADIEEFPAHQFEEAVDPELESKAQEAINRFFCKAQPLLPSPWNPKPESTASLRQDISCGTPMSTHIPICATPNQATNQRQDSDSDLDQSSGSQKVISREVWTQTTLTLPPVLPPSMELALKPFFTFTQDQQQAQQSSEGDDGALSTSTLRRKLFFQSDSSPSPTPSTPPHLQFSVVHGSLSHSLVQCQGRSFGTPLHGNNALQSPPGISPVRSGTTPMRRVKSATRLDFTRDQDDMSVDALSNHQATPSQSHGTTQVGAYCPLGTAPLHDKDTTEDPVERSQPIMKWVKRNKRNSLDCSSDAMSISQTSTPVKSNISMDISTAHSMMDISQSKLVCHAEGWRESDLLVDGTYQHEATSFSYSHQGTSSNMMSQDTGYGTKSSCDPGAFQSGTTSMFGLSLTRDKMGYEDSLATWPINPNVVSSTPTKTLGTRISEYQRDTA